MFAAIADRVTLLSLNVSKSMHDATLQTIQPYYHTSGKQGALFLARLIRVGLAGLRFGSTAA